MTQHHHTARRALASVLLALACLLALGSARALAGPLILENSETFEKVGSAAATVRAQFEPEGLASAYYFEYGPTAQYGSKTAQVSVAEGQSGQVQARALLSGLQPETEYHFRLVATDTTGAGGTTDGPDTAFTTYPASSAALPDNRVFEMVTPPENNNADIYVPEGTTVSSGLIPEEGETVTQEPFQVSVDGDKVVYAGDPSFEGDGDVGEDGGNEYLSTRTANGWKTQNVTPLGYVLPEYEEFSPDLSVGALTEGGLFNLEKPPLAPGGQVAYHELYARENDDGSYRALIAEKPPHRGPKDGYGWIEEGAGAGGSWLKEEEKNEFEFTYLPLYAGASSDFSHVLFEEDDALTPEAEYNPAGNNNLYDSVEGRLTSVNVLPDGKPAPEATFGSYPPQPGEPAGCGGFHLKRPILSGVISADGSRVFWTDLSTAVTAENPAGTTRLFVQENGGTPAAKTVQVDAAVGGGGEYWAASADGSRAFFVKAGALYEFDVNTEQTSDLAPGGEVQGVIGASENGEYVYFVADAKLAAGATAGQHNIYLSHDGTTSFIATSGYNGAGYGCYYLGDWWPDLGDRTAEVTPDGQAVVFESETSPTGYDSRGSSEVYVYDAVSGQLSCASCNPSGEPPSGVSYLPPSGKHHPTYQPRWITDDGSRVFFETNEALVPEDTNGKVDVYEWEREGTGSCLNSKGCIFLLSGGASPNPSYFIGASASGDDVFFVTRAQLVQQDGNDNLDVYDAHVGGMRPPSEAQCTGTGCQGAPYPPTAFEAPASVTFDGVGNFPPPQPQATKPPPKKRTTKKRHRTKRHRKAGGVRHAKRARAGTERAGLASRKGGRS